MQRLSCRTTRRLYYCLIATVVGLGFMGLAMADGEDISISKKMRPKVSFPAAQPQVGGQNLVVPANDECINASVIPPTVPACSAVTTDVLTATPPPGAPSATDPTSCATGVNGFIANSIWYTWTPPVSGFYKISACIGSSCGSLKTLTTAGDGVVAVYTGVCPGPFTQVGCDDDSCGQNGPPPQGSPSIVGPLALTGGVQYYILAGNFSLNDGSYFGTVGQYQIRIESLTPPANDACANAEPLVLNVDSPGNINQLAVDNYQVPATCYTSAGQVGNTVNAGTGLDVTYSFTAPDEDDYSFYLKYFNTGPLDTSPDSILYVSGNCPASNGVIPNCLYAANRNVPICGPGTSACSATQNRSQGGSEYASCIHLTAGQTVFPIVDSTAPSTLSQNFKIEVSRCRVEAEFNGTPAGAEDPDGDGTPGPANSAFAACPVEGSIINFGAFTDIDFFTLGSNPGSRLFAALNCDGMNPNDTSTGINLDMRLTNTTDTLEFDDQDMATLFGNLCPNIEGAILPAVPAYLRVNHLSPTTSAEPYRLHATLRAPGAGPLGTSAVPEDAEPNDNNIQFHDYVYGTHPPPDGTDDFDYFGFAARKSDLVMINQDGDPTKDGTPERNFLVLIDPNGAAIPVSGFGVSAAAASNTTPSPGTLTGTTPRYPGDAIIARAPTTGVYIAEVATAAAILGAATAGDYLFQASINCNQENASGGIEADLSILKTGPATATAGSDISYTIVVTNGGPDLATGAVWTDNLPAGTTFVDLTGPSDWVCATPNPGDPGSVECDETTFTFEGSATFTLTIHVPGCNAGALVNEADVTSFTADPNPANNSSIATTVVTDPGTCDDGNACTTGDACVGGSCVGTPVVCTAIDSCHTAGVCDSGTGLCSNPSLPDGSACDDGSACTTGDSCTSGVCGGTNAPAGTPCTDDTNVCTTDACNGSGVCVHVPNTLACDDLNACTTNDTCSGGICNGGAAANCNDGNVCTDDSCNPSTGCVNSCNNTCNTKNTGYWKKLCHGPHSGEFFTQKDVDCVNNSCTFAGVMTIPEMCDKIDQHHACDNADDHDHMTDSDHDSNDDTCKKCAKAEEKFMALLLNLCRCRIQPNQPIDSHCPDHQDQTAGEAAANSDAALCNPNRTAQDCQNANCAALEVVNGEALWANSLRMIRIGTSIRLTWSEPYAQPDTETNWTYHIWRRVPVPPGAAPGAFTQIGSVHGNTLTFTDTHAAGGNFEYEISAD